VAQSFDTEPEDSLKPASLSPPPRPLSEELAQFETITLDDDDENLEASLRTTLTALEPARILPLHEILVLRIENGHDYYLTVEAEFGPTPAGAASSPPPLSLSLLTLPAVDVLMMKEQHATLGLLRASPLTPSGAFRGGFESEEVS
jgi:hypothetical protein